MSGNRQAMQGRFLLHEHVTMVRVPAHGREDYRNALIPEETARRNTRGIVVHSADRNLTRQINAVGDGLLKAERHAADLGCGDTLGFEVPASASALFLPISFI